MKILIAFPIFFLYYTIFTPSWYSWDNQRPGREKRSASKEILSNNKHHKLPIQEKKKRKNREMANELLLLLLLI